MSQQSSMRRRLDPSAVAKARRHNDEHGPEWRHQEERKQERMRRRGLAHLFRGMLGMGAQVVTVPTPDQPVRHP